MSLRRVLIWAGAALFMGGCALLDFGHSTGEVQAKQAFERATQIVNNQQQSLAPGGVVVAKSPKLLGKMVDVEPPRLPPALNRKIVYRSIGEQPVQEVLQSLARVSGLHIVLHDLDNQAPQQARDAAAAQVALGGAQRVAMQRVMLDIEFEGSVSDLLDRIAQRLDLFWVWDNTTRSVVFARYQSRTFPVLIVPGAKSLKASVSLSGTGAESSSSVSVNQSQQIDQWRALMSGLQQILGVTNTSATKGSEGGDGGNILVVGSSGSAVGIPGLGVVTVTATPAVMRQVQNYIESINKRFARNVYIDVLVYNVTLRDETNAGVSAQLTYSRLIDLMRFANIGVENPVLPSPSSNSPGVVTLNLESMNAGSRSLGLDVIASALSSLGTVSLQTQAQVLAVNGQPTPFQDVQKITYVAQSQSTVVPNVGVQRTASPASETVGFTANFLPIILEDNQILLQYQIQLSSLVDMQQIDMGNGGFIMLPRVAAQNLQQQAFLRDGQAVMLFGFGQDRHESTHNKGILSFGKNDRSHRILNVIVLKVSTGSPKS